MLPEMRTAVSALNKAGLTALEALERCPRDFISLKIEHMLTEAGIQTGTSQQGSSSPPSIATQPSQSKRSKIWETLWLKYLQYQSNWIEEKRGTLMVVATVIATMTFLSAISSPGTAVLAYDWPHGFLKFMTFNTTSFFSSLSVVLLLISGFRLENKRMMWILIMAMTSALTFMGLTYFWAQSLVTPDHIVDKVNRMGIPLSIVWVILLLVTVLVHVVNLFLCVKKLVKKWKKQKLLLAQSHSSESWSSE
ncbi:hypothetical protein JHK87_026779 [Glycine soja]|nr:hypothetical protein JHK87_026779 [Glycine soja]